MTLDDSEANRVHEERLTASSSTPASHTTAGMATQEKGWRGDGAGMRVEWLCDVVMAKAVSSGEGGASSWSSEAYTPLSSWLSQGG